MHMVFGDADTVMFGKELTVTVTVFVFLQPYELVPVTVYVVVVEGLAITVDPVEVFKEEEGDHV